MSIKNEKDYIGKIYNRLTIVKFSHRDKYLQKHYFCKCICGIIKTISLQCLKSGNTKSCGCLRKEGLHKTHGLSKTPIYGTYTNIKGRCFNKNVPEYKYYGKRGITVCKEWKNDFMSFYNWALDNGYKKGLTIDRIDNNGNYTPKNCRWITMQEQVLNQNNKKNNKSGYVGIAFRKNRKKWRASLTYKGKMIFTKQCKTLKEAIKSRNNFIKNNNLPHKIQQYMESEDDS